jgi:Sensors of blue-light using FAD
MQFVGVVYMSRSTRPMTPSDLDHLLLDARSNNAALGVTGVLLHGGSRFFQYFEGSPAAVSEVYERIRRSALHKDLVELEYAPIEQKLFNKWFMGFREVPASVLQNLSQEQWDRERPWAEDHASVSPGIQRLLAFFKDGHSS